MNRKVISTCGAVVFVLAATAVSPAMAKAVGAWDCKCQDSGSTLCAANYSPFFSCDGDTMTCEATVTISGQDDSGNECTGYYCEDGKAVLGNGTYECSQGAATVR